MILQDNSLLVFILGFLILAVAFNLWLTFRLIRAIRLLPIQKAPVQNLEAGTQLSNVTLQRITDKEPATLHAYPEHAKVLVFLTSKCNKCKSKLPELRTSLEKAHEMGVIIWIVTLEAKRRMKRFLQDESLLQATMSADQSGYDYLNPQGASPYYLFIDSENTLQAEGFIGDENWAGFMEQLKEGEA